MSKRSGRARKTAAEDAATRVLLAEVEARFEARERHDRQRAHQLLAEERSARARERLEREALQLQTYRDVAIAQAVSAKNVAPQFVPFITGSSKAEIDASIAQAKAATAEILVEVSGQAPAAGQPRDELGRYVVQEHSNPPMDLENISLEDWAKVRGQFISSTSDRGIFQ